MKKDLDLRKSYMSYTVESVLHESGHNNSYSS